MNNKVAWALVVFSGVFVWVICEAQTTRQARTSRGAPTTGRWYRPPAGYGRPAVYGGYPTYSSTPMEGAGYGVSEVIRARGEAAESASRAINNVEDARSKYMDNVTKWTRTYWERKRTGEAELAKDRDKRLAARDTYLSSRKPASLPRLGPSQLDPATGRLDWPDALMDDQYMKSRTKLEELFLLRAHTSTTTDLTREIHAAADDMRFQLKRNIRKLRPNEYIAARKFLDGLAYEGGLAAG